MSKKVIWTSFANYSLSEIHDHYSFRANEMVAGRIIKKILDDGFKLSSHPCIGQLEPWLEHLDKDYRYALSGNFKLIYRVSKRLNVIFILDVFDTRRDPKEMNPDKG